MPRPNRAILLALGLAVAAAMVPLSGEAYLMRLGTFMLLYSILALSWNFIGGMTGYPSFATSAFFGLGAYVGGVAQTAGWLPVLCWVLAGIGTFIFAFALGFALLRLRGHYFAIATLGVAEVLRELINSATDLTGGGMGLNLPMLKMSVAATANFYYYAMLILAVLTLLAAITVAYSRLGFGLRCIKQNEEASDMIGVNTTLYKTIAFALSAIFVGMAGAIYGSWVQYIEPPDVFEIGYAIKPIVMCLMGGVGSVFGPLIGAAAFLGLEELVWRNYVSLHTGILGLVIVLLVLFMPQGLLGKNGIRDRLKKGWHRVQGKRGGVNESYS